MPPNTPLTELDQLAELIATQNNGVGIDAILQSQSNKLTRRTLQRRLALLVKQGRVLRVGEARAARVQNRPLLAPLRVTCSTAC